MPTHTPATPQRPKGAVRGTDHLQRLTAQPGAVLYAVHNGRVEQWQQVQLEGPTQRLSWPDCPVRRMSYVADPARGRRHTFAHTMVIGPVPAGVQPSGWLFALRGNAEAYAATLPVDQPQPAPAPTPAGDYRYVPDYSGAEMRILAQMMQDQQRKAVKALSAQLNADSALRYNTTVARHAEVLNAISGKIKWY